VTNADEQMSPSDNALLRALADAVGGPPPPTGLVARCEGLLAWIDVDAELATLLDQPVAEVAGTRGSGSAPTTLEFAVDDRSCVIELSPSAASLHGQLLGGEATSVVLRSISGATLSATIDELGDFEIHDPPSGTVRLEFEPLGDLRRIHTEWFVI
jgi:hypothetical protein